MIAPMKKADLVLLERDKAQALDELRALGLVHIEAAAPSGESWDRASRDYEAVSAAMNILPPAKGAAEARLGRDAALELARKVLGIEERKAEIYAERGELASELERCAPWGDFDPAALGALAERGLSLRLYACEAAAEARMPEGVDYLVLSRGKKALRLAAVARGAPAPELPSDFQLFALPAESTGAMRERLRALGSELEGLKAELERAAADLPSLRAARDRLSEELAYEAARCSFQAEDRLCALKGFVPASGAPRLSELAKAQGWALLLDDPAADDVTPTKVENGGFVSAIKPVFDFLGIVPAYTEYEISPYFLGFFTHFTAMIFGDGGYGVLMLLGWAVLYAKSRKAGKGLSDPLKLFLMIALCTMGWGAATGTWFSIPAGTLPAFMRGIEPLSSANPAASKNIQILCFLLGLLQLSIARIKNIIRDFPDPKFIAQAGSLALLVGMLFFVLNLVVDSKRFPVPPFALWLVVLGFSATMVFGAYDGNVLKSALEGLKNIIPNFLGAVGVFADIVSYIRLWALGLAGSALAGIINGMGGGMVKPALIGIVGVAILLFGHGLNLVLNVLSVVVHAVRLNVLEFSCNHLGMQWSGIAYEPFKAKFEDTANKGKESGV